MLLEDLFHSLTARSHATDSEQSKGEGEIILRRVGMHLTQVSPTSSMRRWWKSRTRVI